LHAACGLPPAALHFRRPRLSKLRAAIVPVTGFQQNCTILFEEETLEAAVVDPGGDIERIEAAIGKLKANVGKIVLTHGHIDHAGGAAPLSRKLGVAIEGPHEADRFLLDDLPASGARFGLTGIESVVPDRWLAEGDVVEMAGQTFEVYHCPGHSPGSVVLFCRAERYIQMGDVLFRGSVGRTDLPYGDHEALIRSIKTKLLPLGDDVVFMPGHGPGSTLGEERRHNPFLQGA
jgi:glyoxylase-like metal-dependent hydrolase (beta-lactamase superfamily II)